MFRGLGGNFGVFSDGENLGDVLVLLPKIIFKSQTQFMYKNIYLVRLVTGGAGGKYELFNPSIVCGFNETLLPSFDKRSMAELRRFMRAL